MDWPPRTRTAPVAQTTKTALSPDFATDHPVAAHPGRVQAWTGDLEAQNVENREWILLIGLNWKQVVHAADYRTHCSSFTLLQDG
jgi:hypothetical protein